MITGLQAPADVSPRLKKICDGLSPGKDPVFITIEPDSRFQPDMCFPNVAKLVECEGGETVFGWAIYEWPRVWFELQFHAVWKDPSGEFRDLTPRRDGEKVVLFLQGEEVFDGKPVSSKWFLLCNLPIVSRLRNIQIEIQGLKSEAYLKAQELTFLSGEAKERVVSLEYEKLALAQNLNLNPTRNDLCPCFSRKKFKHCCGKGH